MDIPQENVCINKIVHEICTLKCFHIQVYEHLASFVRPYSEIFFVLLGNFSKQDKIHWAMMTDLLKSFPNEKKLEIVNPQISGIGEVRNKDEDIIATCAACLKTAIDQEKKIQFLIKEIEKFNQFIDNLYHITHYRLLFLKYMEKGFETGRLFGDTDLVFWFCLSCGYTYKETQAIDPCPVCGAGVSFTSRSPLGYSTQWQKG